MGIRDRLKALREQSGASTFAGAAKRETDVASAEFDQEQIIAADSNGLVPDKALQLARGVSLRSRNSNEASKAKSEAELASAIGARVLAPGVLACTSFYPFPHVFGAGRLDHTSRAHAAALLGDQRASPTRLVALDTETTGLAGGTGTLPFLTGVLIVDADGATLCQWLLTRFDGEVSMLDALDTKLQTEDMLLTYNGKSYDLPLLDTRAEMHRTQSCLGEHAHLDLLATVRRAFSGRWPDCRLQTAERELLQRRRSGDIPGSEIPAVWFDWMRGGPPHDLVRVLEHNRLDLIGLVALLERLQAVVESPVEHGARLLPILRHQEHSEAEILKRLTNANEVLDVRERMELARLARRHNQWDLAVAQWQILANCGEPTAIEQLAKFNEHRQRDYARALGFTRRLMVHDGRRPEHVRREARLLRRMDRNVAENLAP
jgi:uncharacterized protein